MNKIIHIPKSLILSSETVRSAFAKSACFSSRVKYTIVTALVMIVAWGYVNSQVTVNQNSGLSQQPAYITLRLKPWPQLRTLKHLAEITEPQRKHAKKGDRVSEIFRRQYGFYLDNPNNHVWTVFKQFNPDLPGNDILDKETDII